jgi:hypothetical protein
MSASPSFTTDPQITAEWQRAIKHDKPYRCLQLQFKGEILNLVKTFPSTSSCAKDFEAVKESAAEQQPCYYLFRIEDSNSWNLISYVPEEGMATQDKMLYAVSKAGLKSKLGIGYFGEDWHANSKKGFTYINYINETASKKDVSFSESEKILMNGLREEEAERTRQMSDHNLKGKSGLNQVSGPLDSGIQRELQRYKAGEVSFVRIGVDSNEKLCLEESKRVNSYEDVKNSLASGMPGFYLFSVRGGPSSNVFLYHCPEKSPKNTRLVYATRMKSVRDNIQACGVSISKSVEMQDAKDLESKVTERSIPAYEYRESAKHTQPATSSPKVDKPHPLFGGQGGQMKKKVVIPPPGAW